MKIQIAREKDHLEIVDTKFYGETFQKLIALPDRKRFKNGRFIFLNSHSNMKCIVNSFPDENMKWDDKAFESFQKFVKFEYEEKKTKAKKEQQFKSNNSKYYPEIFKTTPFDHQLDCFEISKDLEFYGLFFEQGCGKTKVVIDNATYLFKKGEINTLVIIAPNGVHRNWITDELPVHCKTDYTANLWNGKKYIVSPNHDFNPHTHNPITVYAFNIDCFISKERKGDLISILTENDCLLVIDESQIIKNQSAKRTKFILDKAAKLAKYRRIMTGTPVTKGVEDLYTQLKFLSPDIIGISSYYAFKAKYCLMGGFQSKQIIGYKEIENLQEKVQIHTMRVLKKDCLDLPDKLYQKAPFDLLPEQIKIYNEIRDEGIAFIKNARENNEPITFDNVLTRMKKLQQVCSGYLMNVDDIKLVEIIIEEFNPRLLKLKEILKNVNGKVIIWTIYTQDIVYIKRMLGDEAVTYNGKLTSEEKQKNKDLFRKDPKIRYLIANTQAMARGHTLTEAETSIYYNNSYDLELRIQSEDRNHRSGTKNNVLYIDLEAHKTMDKKIIRSLRSKKKIADMVLQDPDNLFME